MPVSRRLEHGGAPQGPPPQDKSRGLLNRSSDALSGGRLSVVAKTFVFALLCATSLNPADLLAQDSGCTRRTIAVGVVDGAWNLVPNLGAANFRGKIHGHNVQILSSTLDKNPRRIVVLLDTSGSVMDSAKSWETEKAIVADLIRFAPPEASIAQIAFSESVLANEGFAQDRAVLMSNLAALVTVCEGKRGGPRKTALYDAIASARDLLGAPNAGDVIFVLSDAADNASQAHEGQVADGLISAGIRLFAAIILTHTPEERASTPEEVDGPPHLRSMVTATGGYLLMMLRGSLQTDPYIPAKTPADAVNLAVQRLYQQMGELYRVEVNLPEKPEKPTKWKLEVIDANGEAMRGVEVHYPQELTPCANANP